MIRSNENNAPKRGTIIMDITGLLRLGQPMDERFLDITSLATQARSALGVLSMLAEQGHKIIIPAGTCYQLANILSDGTDVTDMFGNRMRFAPEPLVEFLKMAVRGNLENVEVAHDGVTELDKALIELERRMSIEALTKGHTTVDAGRRRAANIERKKHLVMDFQETHKVMGIARNDESVRALLEQNPGATLWTERTGQGNAVRNAGFKTLNTRGALGALSEQGLLAYAGLANDPQAIADSLQVKLNAMLSGDGYVDHSKVDGEGSMPEGGHVFEKSLEGIREKFDAEQAEKAARATEGPSRAEMFKKKFSMSTAELLAKQKERANKSLG